MPRKESRGRSLSPAPPGQAASPIPQPGPPRPLRVLFQGCRRSRVEGAPPSSRSAFAFPPRLTVGNYLTFPLGPTACTCRSGSAGTFWRPSSVCRLWLPLRRRSCIQLAIALLDPTGADMALHCHADNVRAIVRARQVKFPSGLAGSQGQEALAEAWCAGSAIGPTCLGPLLFRQQAVRVSEVAGSC